jgi:chromosome segregation ATPase
MPGDDPKLKIQIETAADLKAAADTERAIEGVSDAAEKAQPALEALGTAPEGLQSTAEAAQEAAPAIDSVTEAADAVAPALEEADEEVKAIEEDMRRLMDAARGAAPAINEVKNAAGDLGTSTGDAVSEGDELVDLFNELRQSGGPAIQILRGAVAATRGGPQAFFGTAQGLRGLLTLLKSAGPQGAAAAAAFAAVTAAVTALHVAAGQSRKTVEDYAKEIDDARSATEKLNQSKTDALLAELKALEVQAAATTASLAAVQVQQQAVIDASAQVEIARIAADPTLTPAQRTERTQEVQQRARTGRESLTQQVEQAQISAAQQAARDAARRADDFARRATEASAAREQIATAPDTITAQIQELQRRQGEALKLAALGTGIVAGTSAGEAGRLQREIDDLRRQRTAAEEAREQNLKAAEEALERATRELAEARAEAAAREQAAQDTFIRATAERSARDTTEGGTRQVETIQRTVATREERAEVDQRIVAADTSLKRDTKTVETDFSKAVQAIDQKFAEPDADIAALTEAKNKLYAQRDADLKKLREDYAKALRELTPAGTKAALLDKSETTKQADAIRQSGDFSLASQNAAADLQKAAPSAPSVPSQNLIQRGGGALPSDGQAAPGITVPPDTLKPVADAIKDVSVTLDTTPVTDGVKQAEQNIQRDVGSFATKTGQAFAKVEVNLSAQADALTRFSARMSSLEGKINALLSA